MWVSGSARRRLSLVAAALVLCALTPVAARSAPGGSAGHVGQDGLVAGAAETDITPPPRTTGTDLAEFVPACGTSAEQVATLWPGERRFAFEKPYVDLHGTGRYAPGDPFCDADHTGRYEAPYLAGGSGQNRWPLTADTSGAQADPVSAEAVVVGRGADRIALVTVDSIGLFNSTIERIQAAVRAQAPDIKAVLVSSTHDESAPDPIGLWGPDASDLPGSPPTPAAVSSGVDEYYMSYLVDRVAGAVIAADRPAGTPGSPPSGLQPVRLRVAVARQPANTQRCWSSYPYIDDQLMPVLQAVDPIDGRVVFTLVNANTHVETLAFSGRSDYTSTLSGDWPGRMRAHLEQDWPGSVALELTGLVGSVETPTVYEPESTQVLNVPGSIHGVNGNPDGCSSVYPEPAGAHPVTDALDFVEAYGTTVADTAAAALGGAQELTATTLSVLHRSVCVQLENNLFVAAFAAGLFPDRPAYADPGCTVGASVSGGAALGGASTSAPTRPSAPVYLRTDVAVASIGAAQVVYSPGEIFPFTETRGAIDNAQMPFPTDCYNPLNSDYYCGRPLPMTPWISAELPGSYHFMAGLGEDMIGYLFPPGNFVGTQGETTETPWSTYETVNGGDDRFGHGHADDAESPGPNAGLGVVGALESLVARLPGARPQILPGLYVDSGGHLSDSPFASGGFGGAVGVEVVGPGGRRLTYTVGSGAVTGWATYDGGSDTGTAGTALPYSVATAGVMVGGAALLVDVFSGAHQLGVAGA